MYVSGRPSLGVKFPKQSTANQINANRKRAPPQGKARLRQTSYGFPEQTPINPPQSKGNGWWPRAAEDGTGYASDKTRLTRNDARHHLGIACQFFSQSFSLFPLWKKVTILPLLLFRTQTAEEETRPVRGLVGAHPKQIS